MHVLWPRSEATEAGTPTRPVYLRWGWVTLGLALLAVYTGLGRWHLWGAASAVTAWPLLRGADRAASRRTLGAAWVPVLLAALLALLGTFALPMHPAADWLVERARADRLRLEGALGTLRERMEQASETLQSHLSRPSGGDLPERLEEGWREGANPAWQGAAAAILTDRDGRMLWSGSPHLAGWADPAGTGFRVTGDSLYAVGRLTRDTSSGSLEIVLLLMRVPSATGPAPEAVPVLERLLPRRITGRLSAATDGEGTLRLVVGPWQGGSIPYPARGTLQLLLLATVFAGTLLLLIGEDSVVRGLSAAPLLYASALPILLGVYARLIGPGLLAPSWSGRGLTNQAFFTGAAAGLALWFAVQQREERPAWRPGLPILLAAGMGMAVWGIGLALLQDLYRFAPTWFWARTSLLPGSRDLIGWLIAVALTLILLGGAGGAAASAARRFPKGAVWVVAAAAATGALLSAALGAWSGGPLVSAGVGAAGTAAAAVWLRRTRNRSILVALIGLAVIGAASHLPLKWALSTRIVRTEVEGAAAGLAVVGPGLSAEEVGAAERRLRSSGAGGIPADPNRQAYLVWRSLEVPRADLATGVVLVSPQGRVTGRFTTRRGLFEVAGAESLLARTARGSGGVVITGVEPSYFGEEAVLVGVSDAPAGPLVAGLTRRALSFLVSGEERLWAAGDRSGSADRVGRLAGILYVRIHDETLRLLALPLNPSLAPATAAVPADVVGRLRDPGRGGAWHRRGRLPGGYDEYYFWVESPTVHPPAAGSALTARASVERRLASIGVVRTGLWGHITESISLLVLFVSTILLLVWLPSVFLSGHTRPPARRLRRISFRTRLLIPLLVVSLVPMVALWMLTRTYVLDRESKEWEGGLDQGVRGVQARLLEETGQWAEELAREALRGTRYPEHPGSEPARWAVYGSGLSRSAGDLPDPLADRIPIREAVVGRGPRAFVVRAMGSLWTAAIAPVGPEYEGGAAVVARPLDERALRSALGTSPWEADLYLDGRLRSSTEPAPYTSGHLAGMLPRSVDWEGVRGREASAFHWGAVPDMRVLFAYRPLTDFSGTVTATISLRRFGLWGLRDPAMARLFTTVASIYLLLVGAVTLVALFVARRISLPVGSLIHSARRVAGGDLAVEIPVTRSDEVGGLQKAFRQMLISLRESRDRLALAERERAWQEMARQVAHEIKNPLTPMRLSAQFLRKAYQEDAEDLDRIVQECTDAIVEQVEELRRIADEFSTYARLPHVDRSPCDLNQPLEEALNLYLPALPDGVRVVRELAAGLPLVPLDAEQVRRVAINLIRNALDAMGEEGILTVRSGEDETGVWLQVSDTGEGIATEVQERLFEPYFSTRTDGTGLGLAISRAVVDAHGGTIRVQSRPLEGTEMTAHFPRGKDV